MAYDESASMRNRCPHCGRPWPTWMGVHMYPQTGRIFDLIRGAGRVGINGQEIMRLAYAGMRKPNYHTVKKHIDMAREALAETDYEIRCSRTGRRADKGVYRLVKVVKVSAFG